MPGTPSPRPPSDLPAGAVPVRADAFDVAIPAGHGCAAHPDLWSMESAMPLGKPLARGPTPAAPRSETGGRVDVDRRAPRKIRYTAAEWAVILARARACGKTPARYVREVSLGARPKVRRGNRAASDESGLLAHLARIGNSMNQLARVANTSGRLPSEAILRDAVGELLAVVRHVD